MVVKIIWHQIWPKRTRGVWRCGGIPGPSSARNSALFDWSGHMGRRWLWGGIILIQASYLIVMILQRVSQKMLFSNRSVNNSSIIGLWTSCSLRFSLRLSLIFSSRFALALRFSWVNMMHGYCFEHTLFCHWLSITPCFWLYSLLQINHHNQLIGYISLLFLKVFFCCFQGSIMFNP